MPRTISLVALACVPIVFGATTSGAETTACVNIAALPATISTPGIYCLKQNLTTSSVSGNAITIAANNVTLDLNGFKLGGLAGGASTQAVGVFAAGRRNISIRNGTVQGFGRAVQLQGTGVESDTSGTVVEDLRVEASRLGGISVVGTDAQVMRNVVVDTGAGVSTGAIGIYVEGDAATVSDNIVNRVTETGFAVGISVFSSDGAVVQRNQVRDTTGGTANYGIRTGGAAVVIESNVIVNAIRAGQTGIFASGARDLCIGNIVSEMYSTALGGCEEFSNNLTF